MQVRFLSGAFLLQLCSGGMEYEMNKKKKNHNYNAKQEEKKLTVEAMKETVEKNKEVNAKNHNKAENIKTEDKAKEKFQAIVNRVKNASPEGKKAVTIAALKVALPVLAMIIVIAIIVSLVRTKNEKQGEETAAMTEQASDTGTVLDSLEVDAHPEINELMTVYYNALAAGDMEEVQSVMDYISETDWIQLKSKNEFVESYNNLVCYTRKGIDENSYFVYVTYEAKFHDFDVMVPGVTTHYVYTAEDGSLKIAKEMNEQVNAALMLTSCQDDVVDIFNKVDVEYKDILASNEDLNTFLADMASKAKTMAGEEIAMLEAGEETEQTEETEAEGATENVEEEQPQTQLVNEEVKTTATVNVRSSDSENADKVGRVETGTVLTRVENKINGWSKVIYEGKEAYIKSDYLEVVAVNAVEEITDNDTAESADTNAEDAPTAGTVKARTNVNVRNKASQSADAIGVAEGGSSYKVLENQGEWLKIEYKGQVGFVKAEFFD